MNMNYFIRLCGEARWSHDQIKIYERNTVGIGKPIRRKKIYLDFIGNQDAGS